MRRLAGIATLMIAGAVSAGATRSATHAGGLYGIVERGPITPVCRIGRSCDAPVSVTLRFTRASDNRGRVFRVTSDTNGRYRIELPPGRYTVSASGRSGIDHVIRPRAVRALSARWAAVDFFIDTGIR